MGMRGGAVAAAASLADVVAGAADGPVLERVLVWSDGEAVGAFGDGVLVSLSARRNALSTLAAGDVAADHHLTAFGCQRGRRAHAAILIDFLNAVGPLTGDERPYLCAGLVRRTASASTGGRPQWCAAEAMPDGSVVVADAHGAGELRLSPSGRLCRATWAAQVRDPAADEEARKYSPEAPLPFAPVPRAAPMLHVWQTQWFTAATCPEAWKVPLRAAIVVHSAAEQQSGAPAAAQTGVPEMRPSPFAATLPLLSDKAELRFPALDHSDLPVHTTSAVLSRAAVAARHAKSRRRPRLVYERRVGAVAWVAGGTCEALVLHDDSTMELLSSSGSVQAGAALPAEGSFVSHSVDDARGRDRIYHHALDGACAVPSSAPRRVRCRRSPLTGAEEYQLRPVLDLVLHLARDGAAEADPLPRPGTTAVDSTVHASVRVEGVGNFVALRDGRARVHYDDRCIVELRGDGEEATAEMLLPCGEKLLVRPFSDEVMPSGAARDYAEGAVQFREWAFMTPAERIAQRRADQERIAGWVQVMDTARTSSEHRAAVCQKAQQTAAPQTGHAARCEEAIAAAERARRCAADAARRSHELLASLRPA